MKIFFSVAVLILLATGALIPMEKSSENYVLKELLTPQRTRATIYVNDDVMENATWSGTVYIGSNIAVKSGYNVTISPGTEVIFNASASGDRITVEGGLQAVGNAGGRIVFKSDNMVVGDPGSSDLYTGFVFSSSSVSPSFKYCDFLFGQYCIDTYVEATVENCRFIEYKYNGVKGRPGVSLTASDLFFSTNSTASSVGLYAKGIDSMDLSNFEYLGMGTCIELIAVSNVDIPGFKGNTSGGPMIDLDQCGNVTVTDPEFYSSEGGCLDISGGIDVQISGCDVVNLNGDGIALSDSIDIVVDQLTGLHGSGNLISLTDTENAELSDLNVQGGSDDSSNYLVNSVGCNKVVLHNSTLTANKGDTASFSTTQELHLADTDLHILGSCEGVTVMTSVLAVIERISLTTDIEEGFSIMGGGDCVINDFTGVMTEGSNSILVLAGSTNYTGKRIDLTIYDDGIGISVMTTGTTELNDIDIVPNNGTAINDISTSTSTYVDVEIRSVLYSGMNILYGTKTFEELYINITEGTAFTGMNVDELILNDVTILGGGSGIYVSTSTVTATNIYLDVLYNAITTMDADATLSKMYIETDHNFTAININGGTLEISETQIYNSGYGIMISGDGVSVVCYTSEIVNSMYGIYVYSMSGDLDITSMNIINFQYAGIFSMGLTFAVENIWFGHAAPFVQGSSVGTDPIDANNFVTLDESIRGPIDIPDVEQATSVSVTHDSPQPTYLYGTVNFDGTVSDPDEEDVIDGVRCRIYEKGTTPAAWDDVELQNIGDRTKFTYEWDSGGINTGYVILDVEVTLSDNSVFLSNHEFYVSNTAYVPDDDVSDDDVVPSTGGDGDGTGDAPDDLLQARHIEIGVLYNTNNLNSSSDIDWYKVRIENLKTLSVELSESTSVTLTVYDSDFKVIGNISSGDDDLILNDPPEGTLYLRVTGTDASGYTFMVSGKEKVKEKSLFEKFMDQGWFMLAMELCAGIFLTVLMASLGIFFASRKRRSIAKKMKEVEKTYNENKENPAAAISKLTEMHRSFEEEFSKGKLSENHYMLLDKKITDHLGNLKELEAKEREQEVEREHLPPELEVEIKDAVADGQVTPEEAEKIIGDVEASDLPEDQKEEVKEMVESWEKEDEGLPPAPPSPPPPA
jgi:hypothetical protein